MAKNSTRVKGKSAGATKTAPAGVTKARYILVAGKPFSCYTGTKAFAWSFANKFPSDKMEVHHAGTCGRCGRKLTVPESIRTGLGPECAGKVGC